MPRKLRVFLDTSAIVTGLNSPHGAAGVILASCFAKTVIPVISPQIIEESERIIAQKFPRLNLSWAGFLLIPPTVIKSPSMGQVRLAYELLPTNDAPILAAALHAKLDALVTWNTRDFMRPAVQDAAKFPIVTPGDFLRLFRDRI